MTDKEKIKAEVLRLKDAVGIGLSAYDMGTENGAFETCEKILQFINSLPEEHVSEDLEKAADKHALQCYSKEASTATLAASKYDFIAGANWKEQQMMKDAIDGLVICDEKLTHGYKDIAFNFPEELKVDDKVKMIIIKEN